MGCGCVCGMEWKWFIKADAWVQGCVCIWVRDYGCCSEMGGLKIVDRMDGGGCWSEEGAKEGRFIIDDDDRFHMIILPKGVGLVVGINIHVLGYWG